VSVFVRDDTVSIRQPVLAMALPGFPPVFTVSLADVRGGLGCGTPPGQAGCNTSSPWRAVPWPGHRGRRDLEGLPCCCAPMPLPPAPI
jgi:hypothetical protein